MFRPLFAVMLLGLASSELLIINSDNSTEMEMVDLDLQFTAPLPDDGLIGQIVTANPEEACEPIAPPPSSNSSLKWFVLIKRCQCQLADKVGYAQKAGFDAVVVYNVGGKLCQSSRNSLPNDFKIVIPGVLIGESDGKQINSSYQWDKGYVIVINPDSPFNLNTYLLPFAVVIGISFLVMLTFMIIKCIKDRRRNRRNRLSSRHLKQLPTLKFKKGDEYDVCAVCLEEYCEGDKLRILPCEHAYHKKCIDPWLTNNRRTCPMCKRKVVLKGFTSDSESETDDESPSERTPLIRSERSTGRTDGGTFSGSSHSPVQHVVSEPSDADSSSEELYHSALCHHSPVQEDVVGTAVPSSSQVIASTAHSINSEDGFQSSQSMDNTQQVTVHIQNGAEGTNSKKRKQDMVV